MAARINKLNHEEKTKGLIRATQLLNRLFSHANGEIELKKTQIDAAKIVIGKYIPDLKAIELSNKEGEAFRLESLTRTVIDPAK